MNEKLVNKFGYSEMYEWVVYPGDTNKYARFVQFNDSQPSKINLVRNDKNVIGVSTINYVEASDNPENWHLRYTANEYGDLFMMKERLAVGNKTYDQIEEFSYIRTFPYEQYIPVENDNYDKDRQYQKRTARQEWVNVTIKGKAIVKDNGQCKPGQYCKPQYSEIFEDAGIAVPATEDEKNSFYVIDRVSDHSILIFIK